MRLLVSEGFFFMFVVLKLPLVAVSVLVYWAMNAEPRELEPVRLATPGPRPWSPLRRGTSHPRVRGPHGPHRRVAPRAQRVAALPRAGGRR